MTKERAVEVLSGLQIQLKVYSKVSVSQEQSEALDVAISSMSVDYDKIINSVEDYMNKTEYSDELKDGSTKACDLIDIRIKLANRMSQK